MARYEIIDREEIAASAWGKVYRGYNTTLDSDVAILELHPCFRDQQDEVWRRVVAAQKNEHDLVVSVKDVDEEKFWVVTELRGASIRRFVRGEKGLSQASGRKILTQLLEIIEFFESRDFTHGDIRPDTMLTQANDPIVKAIEAVERARDDPSASDDELEAAENEVETAMTGAPRFKLFFSLGATLGGVVPTVNRDIKYAAPEMLISDFGELTSATDMYCAAFAVLELLAGPRFDEAFEQINAASLEATWISWHGNASQALPPVRDVVPNIAPDLEAALTAMLQKRPTDRPKSAREALDLLDVRLNEVDEPLWSQTEDESFDEYGQTNVKGVVTTDWGNSYDSFADEEEDVAPLNPLLTSGELARKYALKPYVLWPACSAVVVALLLAVAPLFTPSPWLWTKLNVAPKNAQLYLVDNKTNEVASKPLRRRYDSWMLPPGKVSVRVYADGYVDKQTGPFYVQAPREKGKEVSRVGVAFKASDEGKPSIPLDAVVLSKSADAQKGRKIELQVVDKSLDFSFFADGRKTSASQSNLSFYIPEDVESVEALAEVSSTQATGATARYIPVFFKRVDKNASATPLDADLRPTPEELDAEIVAERERTYKLIFRSFDPRIWNKYDREGREAFIDRFLDSYEIVDPEKARSEQAAIRESVFDSFDKTLRGLFDDPDEAFSLDFDANPGDGKKAFAFDNGSDFKPVDDWDKNVNVWRQVAYFCSFVVGGDDKKNDKANEKDEKDETSEEGFLDGDDARVALWKYVATAQLGLSALCFDYYNLSDDPDSRWGGDGHPDVEEPFPLKKWEDFCDKGAFADVDERDFAWRALADAAYRRATVMTLWRLKEELVRGNFADAAADNKGSNALCKKYFDAAKNAWSKLVVADETDADDAGVAEYTLRQKECVYRAIYADSRYSMRKYNDLRINPTSKKLPQYDKTALNARVELWKIDCYLLGGENVDAEQKADELVGAAFSPLEKLQYDYLRMKVAARKGSAPDFRKWRDEFLNDAEAGRDSFFELDAVKKQTADYFPSAPEICANAWKLIWKYEKKEALNGEGDAKSVFERFSGLVDSASPYAAPFVEVESAVFNYSPREIARRKTASAPETPPAGDAAAEASSSAPETP